MTCTLHGVENLRFDDKLSSFLRFALFSLGYFPKEIENIFFMFLSRYRNTCEGLGELEKNCGNTRLRLVFPQHFSFSQTSSRVSITQ